jgi:hypothetical protein
MTRLKPLALCAKVSTLPILLGFIPPTQLFIKKADSLGYKVQTTLSGSLPDLPIGNTSLNQGRILNKSGQKVTASWMRTWESWWGCVNHPEFQASYFGKIDLKAVVESWSPSSIQVDGPAMNYLLHPKSLGGCLLLRILQKKAEQHLVCNPLKSRAFP